MISQSCFCSDFVFACWCFLWISQELACDFAAPEGCPVALYPVEKYGEDPVCHWQRGHLTAHLVQGVCLTQDCFSSGSLQWLLRWQNTLLRPHVASPRGIVFDHLTFSHLFSYYLWEIRHGSCIHQQTAAKGKRLASFPASQRWYLVSKSTFSLHQSQFIVAVQYRKQELPPLITLSHTKVWLNRNSGTTSS